jgi:hypothetical protein
LADEVTVKAYTDHLEAQMPCGKVRKLLSRVHVFRRTGAVMFDLDPGWF